MLEGGSRLLFWHCKNSVSEATGHHDDMRQTPIFYSSYFSSCYPLYHQLTNFAFISFTNVSGWQSYALPSSNSDSAVCQSPRSCTTLLQAHLIVGGRVIRSERP